jgi:hypothetical protein
MYFPKHVDFSRCSLRSIRQCSDLVAADHDVKTVARNEGVTPWAIYKRRARFEQRIGYRLPRASRAGRKPSALLSSVPAGTFDTSSAVRAPARSLASSCWMTGGAVFRLAPAA